MLPFQAQKHYANNDLFIYLLNVGFDLSKLIIYNNFK